jgi:hypothetical protein
MSSIDFVSRDSSALRFLEDMIENCEMGEMREMCCRFVAQGFYPLETTGQVVTMNIFSPILLNSLEVGQRSKSPSRSIPKKNVCPAR